MKVLAIWLLLIGSAIAQERVDVQSRPGVTQPVYITAAANPRATVLLFPGAAGVYEHSRNNFLVRVAPQFSAAGMTVAVFDTPSDHPNGMGQPFRASPQHGTDIAAVVALLKSRSPAPLWLVGTSNGSISAAEGAAVVGRPGIAGTVLTSSVWQGGMLSTPLGQIRMPVLVVHNHDDGCRFSPFSDTASSMALMTQASPKELLAVSGGSQRSDPCQALSPHGYYGIENQVVPSIIAWIQVH
ncbi:MAG TPA: alpha/beta hydrolase [Acetobacteraceae bacterium]|nr:alpha/beta hydrolase [Acetobacteraceae bacterium]